MLDPKRFPILSDFMKQEPLMEKKAQAAEPEGQHDDQFVDPSKYTGPFELTKEVEKFLTEYKLKDQIEIMDEGEEKMARIKDSVALELAKTEKVFKSQKYADERMEGMEDDIKELVKKIGAEEVGSEFEFDVEVSYRESNYGNPAHFYDVTLKKGDYEEELSLLYYTYEPGINAAEYAESGDNTFAWLSIPESPFYDSDFVDAYDYDYMTTAMGEMFATFNESQDLWDVRDAVTKLEKKYVPTYYFFVNKDERGEFYADVRDEKDNTIYEIKSEPAGEDEEGNYGEGLIPQVEDGFMRHATDIQGLEKYLISLEIIPKKAQLVKGQ